jgi:hypothetical protein
VGLERPGDAAGRVQCPNRCSYSVQHYRPRMHNSFVSNIEQFRLVKEGADEWNLWRLQHADIDVDLSRADLHEANLRKANFRKANFRKANLYRANLSGADLRAADLRRANLHATSSGWRTSVARTSAKRIFVGPPLLDATLNAVDLGKASVGWTVFVDVDLKLFKHL